MKTFKSAALAALLSAAPAAAQSTAESADAGASEWLMKINRAAATQSFTGVFVHLYAGELETTRVVHRVRDGLAQARLYSLDGERREVVRDAERVWCYMPDKKVGVADDRQVFRGGFPRLEAGDLARVRENYRVKPGGIERIADRPAQRLDIAPADHFRYGYRLWADRETGLLLRSDLVGGDGAAVEKYQFTHIDFAADISDRDLQAVTGKAQLTWYANDAPAVLDAAANAGAETNWRFEQRPPGYELSKRIRRMSPLDGREIEHFIWSDGLSTLSVFIKPAGGGGDGGDGDGGGDGGEMEEGLSRMGAVHAYHRKIGDHRITVMGETPARTVRAFAEGMRYGGQ